METGIFDPAVIHFITMGIQLGIGAASQLHIRPLPCAHHTTANSTSVDFHRHWHIHIH